MKQSQGNARRAKIIAQLAKHYLGENIDADNLSADEYITDLLADIRHYCDSENLEFAKLDRIAQGHYAQERGELR